MINCELFKYVILIDMLSRFLLEIHQLQFLHDLLHVRLTGICRLKEYVLLKITKLVYCKFSKNSASLIIQHLLHYNKIISLKKFGTYNTLV